MPERGVADEMAQGLAAVREDFRTRAPERVAQIRRHADAWKANTPGSVELFVQAAHGMRGTAGTLGFTEVARICNELEKLGEGESPAWSPRIPGLIQSLTEAISQPPSNLPLVPHRPRVLVKLADANLTAELARHLEALGMDVAAPSTEEEAVKLITGDRPVERVVVGPTVPAALRTALRSLSTPPPLVLLAPAAEARTTPRDGADAVLSIGTPPQALARELVTIQRTSPARFRVLCVDDDPAVLATARAVLEAAGIEVVTLSDGRNLFSGLKLHHPDLLLLDVSMPSVDGFELLTQLRGEPTWRALTVVFHTAKDASADRVRAFQLGVDDYLVKPVEPAELRLRLIAHLQRRALQRASAEKEGSSGASAQSPRLERPLSSSRMEQSSSRLELTPAPSSSRLELTPAPSTRTPAPAPASSRLESTPSRMSSSSISSSTSASTSSSTSAPPSRPTAPPIQPTAATPPARPSGSLRVETVTVSAPRSPLPPVSIPTPPPVRLSSLPRDENGSSSSSRPPSSSRPGDTGPSGQPRSHRILVADDEPALRRVLQRLLEQEGYVVETVEDGEEALARLLNPNLTPVDLLLLDVHMPRRSGIEVLRAMREASSPVRALVLSARIRDTDVMKLMSEGAADFVAKPFSIHTLLARVHRLLPPRSS